MTDNEKLIEEAAKALTELTDAEWEIATAEGTDHLAGYFDAARRILAVFEKAHTPTDDEREAARVAHLDARQAAMQQDRVDWFPEYDREPTVAHDAFVRGWDAAVDGRFRRPEEPQGEPSDAVANAVARAIIEHDEDRLTCYDHPEDFCCPCGTHGMSRSEWQRHRARAALRAAGGVR